MKIVYLILAHNKPKQLRRLVYALENKDASFVVHIDARVAIEPFQDSFKDSFQVHFITERISTAWGSYNIIEATLNGLKYIVQNLPEAKHIVLLSGQDYPIKPSSYIHSFFSDNEDSIYIEYFKVPDQRWSGGNTDRFPNFEHLKGSIDIYGGSQWWSFPRRVASFMLDFLEFNPDFITYFKAVTIPYEGFFQTLLLNCDEEFIINNLKNDNLKLVKWDVPYLHSSILELKDFDDIKGSECLFAHKFGIDKQVGLLNLIDEEIHGELNLRESIVDFQADNGNEKTTQAILYLTHKNTISVLIEYKKLQCAASKTDSRATILFHDKGELLEREIKEESPFIFDNSILNSLNYKAIKSKLVPGSNHFPLLQYYLQNDQYDYYWYVEDDVRYNASWEHFFNFFINNNVSSDFIASNICDYESEPNWYWWNTLRYLEDSINDGLKVRSFNPIFRISNAALKFIHESLSNGWSGHHEVLIPTLLKQNGFIINDFGGDGPYILPGCLNRFYKPGIPDVFGGLNNSSMRFRPFIEEDEMNQALLYHPVKIKGFINNDWQKSGVQ